MRLRRLWSDRLRKADRATLISPRNFQLSDNERAVRRQLLVLGQISYFPARSLLAKYVSASGISCASILDITRMLESGESMSYPGVEIWAR